MYMCICVYMCVCIYLVPENVEIKVKTNHKNIYIYVILNNLVVQK